MARMPHEQIWPRCDVLLALFFLIHPLLIVFIGAQIVAPIHWFPTLAREVLSWYVKNTGDFLMGDPPLYYKAFMVAEIVFQLPLYIANAYAFFLRKKWGRMTGIVYGVHVATTMIPILTDIVASGSPERNTLLGIYIPYLAVPLIVLVRLLPHSDPFASPAPKFSVVSNKVK